MGENLSHGRYNHNLFWCFYIFDIASSSDFFFLFVFRIAKLFNHNELEAVKDRKDKFKRWVHVTRCYKDKILQF